MFIRFYVCTYTFFPACMRVDLCVSDFFPSISSLLLPLFVVIFVALGECTTVETPFIKVICYHFYHVYMYNSHRLPFKKILHERKHIFSLSSPLWLVS